jgi:carbonic anhydrase
MSTFIPHQITCACCAEHHPPRLGRRLFMGMAGVVGAAGLLPRLTLAASGKYEAMLLNCIDPRFPEPTIAYMRQRDLVGKYSQISLAGAGIAVVAPAFDKWRPAFWDNLAASIQLHAVPKLIVLDHRACGAAGIAYGADSVSTPAKETATHRQALADLRSQVKARHPSLSVETGLMALDGSVQMFTS